MYEPKTKQNEGDVQKYLDSFKEEERYSDLLKLLELMSAVSGCPAKMWGTQIVGFDSYSYKGKSSQGEWFCIGFSARKQNISLYIISGFEKETELLNTMGKYKTGKGCMYINALSDINLEIFEEFLKRSMVVMRTW